MTQEELDALMNGDIDNLDEEVQEEKRGKEEETVFPEEEGPLDITKSEGIYPPPATEDHKVVSQLDEVTKESEEKATEILDIMDNISNAMMDNEENLNKILEFLNEQKELFEMLNNKFPHIKTFSEQLEKIRGMIELVDSNIANTQDASDNIMMAMDIMQFQDIHRQKIERVINIMRELLKYMNRIFEGKIDDTKRVSSARHIHGDTTTENVVEEDDLEALIAQFAGKK
jgi:chemotaxis regulatin CheY-phosphate phosphatase CheZ